MKEVNVDLYLIFIYLLCRYNDIIRGQLWLKYFGYFIF